MYFDYKFNEDKLIREGEKNSDGRSYGHEDTSNNAFMNIFIIAFGSVAVTFPLCNQCNKMGPVISHPSRTRIHGMITKAVDSGARVRAGGAIPSMPGHLSSGCYYPPTVLEVNPIMEIWKEEVFPRHILHLL